jgi:hypothetical protein
VVACASECERKTADVRDEEGETRGEAGSAAPSAMVMVAIRRKKESGRVSFMVVVLSLVPSI